MPIFLLIATGEREKIKIFFKKQLVSKKQQQLISGSEKVKTFSSLS